MSSRWAPDALGFLKFFEIFREYLELAASNWIRSDPIRSRGAPDELQMLSVFKISLKFSESIWSSQPPIGSDPIQMSPRWAPDALGFLKFFEIIREYLELAASNLCSCKVPLHVSVALLGLTFARASPEEVPLHVSVSLLGLIFARASPEEVPLHVYRKSLCLSFIKRCYCYQNMLNVCHTLYKKLASECFRSLQNASKCFQMLPDASRCFRMLQNAPECFPCFYQTKVQGFEVGLWFGFFLFKTPLPLYILRGLRPRKWNSKYMQKRIHRCYCEGSARGSSTPSSRRRMYIVAEECVSFGGNGGAVVF